MPQPGRYITAVRQQDHSEDHRVEDRQEGDHQEEDSQEGDNQEEDPQAEDSQVEDHPCLSLQPQSSGEEEMTN